ncbi:MAG: ATP-binding cassette domain-containing protein [Rhodothermaceae bacterium]|nr:ATP-binding cassette domain-containing protein [Rhodothermaceae bacterium]
MLILRDLSYIHPNKDVLFKNISLTVNNLDKIALIGNNGVGKSTLLQIISGKLQQSTGRLEVEEKPYYLPQIYGQYDHFSIAQALKVEAKLRALTSILNGRVSEEDYEQLDEDWDIETRCAEALVYWQLSDLNLNQSMRTLSGGQKTRVLLAGITIHQPKLVLMDEPSNHLDLTGRHQLYRFIESTSRTLLIVSHDRRLLNLLDSICEMNQQGISVYGGNYDFYVQQKQLERDALSHTIQSKERIWREAKKKQRETVERQQKLDARGKRKQVKSGMPKIMMNKMKNDAENSSSKLKSVHLKKIDGIKQELQNLRSLLPDIDKIKFGFEHSSLHKGKILFAASNLNYSYETQHVWDLNLHVEIRSGERIALKGKNGSGKTTLIKLILGDIEPHEGTIKRADFKSVYIDQDYSLINTNLSIYKQAQRFNTSILPEHEVKIRLDRFLFGRETWDKPCSTLSGGERMRLMLCCLTINHHAPDMIILDEPTNNLDIQNIEIVTRTITAYQGTLIVVSHDERFLEEIGVQRVIELK